MAYNYNAYPWGRWIKWGIVGFLVLILIISAISTYNGIVTAEQEMEKSWSQVENVMQRRLDTIPNLVEVVKGYAKHEEKVFGDIAEARSVLMNSSADIDQKVAADEKLTQATKEVLLLVENYPELKASQQFHDLQVAIEGAENRVSVERGRFIEKVQAYNMKIKRFPGNIFARLMGFTPKEYYKADPEAAKAPKVDFSE